MHAYCTVQYTVLSLYSSSTVRAIKHSEKSRKSWNRSRRCCSEDFHSQYISWPPSAWIIHTKAYHRLNNMSEKVQVDHKFGILFRGDQLVGISRWFTIDTSSEVIFLWKCMCQHYSALRLRDFRELVAFHYRLANSLFLFVYNYKA